MFLFVHCLRYNNYSTDIVYYVGSAVAIATPDPVTIHDVTYAAVLRDVPATVVPHILGLESGEEAAVRRDQHANAYHFVGFLTYYSVKPLYIAALSILHKLGVGLVQSIVLVSSASFIGIAILLALWVTRLNGSILAACLLLLSPEVRTLGQGIGPDGLSLVFLAAGLLSVFEWNVAVGVAGLLASIWIRPDNVILVALVIVFLAWTQKVRHWMALVLLALALATPPIINHFGGNPGIQVLYQHTFFLERAPGEFSKAAFTARDYWAALAGSARTMLSGSAPAFGLLGVIGYVRVSRMRACLALCGISSVVKFLVYPNYEPRYYAITFFAIGVAACVAIAEFGSSSRDRWKVQCAQ